MATAVARGAVKSVEIVVSSAEDGGPGDSKRFDTTPRTKIDRDFVARKIHLIEIETGRVSAHVEEPWIRSINTRLPSGVLSDRLHPRVGDGEQKTDGPSHLAVVDLTDGA